MNLTLDDLEREAAATGFLTETLEKAIRLLSLLDGLRSHPFLKTRIALKGGTALNLFVFDVPRLSVDIDLNYIGGPDRDVMLAERPKIEQAVQAVCEREGLKVNRVPQEHAGGKWRLTYASAAGGSGNLEVDVNFLLRTPLWPVLAKDSWRIGTYQATQVPVLDFHELAGGKLAALLSRTAGRDLFDTCELLRRQNLDRTKLRLAFVIYGGASRKDWRTVSLADCLSGGCEGGRYRATDQALAHAPKRGSDGEERCPGLGRATRFRVPRPTRRGVAFDQTGAHVR